MYAKLIVLTVLLVGLAGSLLMLRHQRVRVSSELVTRHAQAQRLHRELWQVQADAAALLTPRFVKQQIERAQLALEPATPDVGDGPLTDFARHPIDPTPPSP